jgi:ribosomal protein S18 acetylase RimI-like enzyme
VDIRKAVPEDAAAYAALRAAVLFESEFLLREPDEYHCSIEEAAAEIQTIDATGNSRILVAKSGAELVGFAIAKGGALKRTRHAALIFMAVRRDHCGRGVARALMSALINWGRDAHLRRLELQVSEGNERAIGLYRSLGGLEVEGVRRMAVWSGGQFHEGVSTDPVSNWISRGVPQCHPAAPPPTSPPVPRPLSHKDALCRSASRMDTCMALSQPSGHKTAANAAAAIAIARRSVRHGVSVGYEAINRNMLQRSPHGASVAPIIIWVMNRW